MSTETYHYKNPSWWSPENESGWERVKRAFQRDWDQTKHDFGGDEPDTLQSVGNTVSQAAGKEPIPPRGFPTYDEIEPAYRLGYGARGRYVDTHDVWSPELESQLKRDWEAIAPEGDAEWTQARRDAVRRGFEYSE